jgi:hypothetical protein
MARRELSIEEALVWAFQRERVHLARVPGLGVAGRRVANGFAHADPIARMGVGVNVSLNLGFEAPADAYPISYAVRELPERYAFDVPGCDEPGELNVRRLVFDCARTGTQPAYCANPRPLAVENGGLVYDANNRPWYSVVTYRGDTTEGVIRARTIFLVWRIALEALRDRLQKSNCFKSLSITDELPEIPA